MTHSRRLKDNEIKLSQQIKIAENRHFPNKYVKYWSQEAKDGAFKG